MNKITFFNLRTLVLVAVLTCGRHASGQLTATVSPGYQYTSGERPTVTTLNQLGQPSIAISGTVGGSVGLTAASVTGVHLADSVVDARSITFSNNSPRSMTVNTTNLAGNGLTGASSVFALNASNKWFCIENDFLALTNLTTTAVAVPTSNTIYTNTHGFASTPEFQRGVLVCTNAELGWSVNDEISLRTVWWTNSETYLPVQFFEAADSTKIYNNLAGSVSWFIFTKTNASSRLAIAKTNWNVKFYARP